MTDIVERLRACENDPMWADHAEIPKMWCKQAADEIERLTRELDKAHRLISQSIGWQRDVEIAKFKLEQDIGQLREMLATPTSLHWLGDGQAASLALDATGCVAYFATKDECFRFMEILGAGPTE